MSKFVPLDGWLLGFWVAGGEIVGLESERGLGEFEF